MLYNSFSEEGIEAKIREILAKMGIKVREITRTTSFYQLGMTQSRIKQLVTQVDRCYSLCGIPQKTFTQKDTIQDVINYVEEMKNIHECSATLCKGELAI